MVYSSDSNVASHSSMSQDKNKFGTSTHVIRVVHHVFSPTLNVTCSNPSYFPSLVQLLTGNHDSSHQVDGVNGHPIVQDFNSIDCTPHSSGHLVAGHSSLIGHNSHQFPLHLDDELDTTPRQNRRTRQVVDNLTPHKSNDPIHANDAPCKVNHTEAQDGLVDNGLHRDINVESIEDIIGSYYDQHSYTLDALHDYDVDLHIARSINDVDHDFYTCRY